jgi:two-component system OmpR family sensor kinase
MLSDGDLGELNADQRTAVSEMQAQGADLVRMIDELLELGRTRSPEFAIQAVPLDPAAFLRDVRAEWSVRLPRLTSVVASDVPDLVADVDVLRRVFDNLLMNALVHAGPDASVTMAAERADDLVRITVADDGPGVQGNDAERIFDPFVTLGGAGSHRTHGLGLAYCRAALAAMDGTIALGPGERGATFVVELPAAVVLARRALEQDQ